ncbi:hypothetical protein [Telluria beijingensis]|uniref:hypothetical protein n=1 Tax=Telluria beijingensis TaxID=3068633 RepID=UPI0027962327|nr:hypothetical protein [Massilia sp. REN29]
MQQPRPRVPSPTMNFVIAALLGVPGMLNVYGGITRSSPGDILSGLAALVYAALLVRDALHIKKTGLPAIPQARMLLIGFGCLTVYLIGMFMKHSG